MIFSRTSRLVCDRKRHLHFSFRITILYTALWESCPVLLVIKGKCHCGRAGVNKIFARLWAPPAIKIAFATMFVGAVCPALRLAADNSGRAAHETLGGADLLQFSLRDAAIHWCTVIPRPVCNLRGKIIAIHFIFISRR
jgi:hypothetical protein